MTSIYDCVFLDCIYLTSITIPDSVKSIGSWTFGNCSVLTSVNFLGSVEQWNAISLDVHWDANVGEYTIYCTDGEIAKDGTVIYY